MTNTANFDSFLKRISSLASEDSGKRRQHLAEEAPEFYALSFFRSRETIVSEILAYLLNPYSPHGQGQIFLKKFIEVLGLRLRPLLSVVVQSEAPCFTLPGRRRIDLLIRFRTDSLNYVIAIESKSHFAADQPNQIRDYLDHLKFAYKDETCRLFYLHDGKPPTDISIPPSEWDKAHAAGLCDALEFRSIISNWLSECRREDGIAHKLKYFLSDFARFAGVEEKSPMLDKSAVQKYLKQVIEESTSIADDVSSELDGVLAIYSLHEKVWQFAITQSLERVRAIAEKLLPNWDSKIKPYFDEPIPYCELHLWKRHLWTFAPDGEPNLSVVLATEDEPKTEPPRLVMVIRKHDDFRCTRASFKEGKLIVGPRKEQFWCNTVLNGVENIKDAETLRYMLTHQGAEEIAQQLDRFIEENETKMDACFIRE